MLRTRLLSTVQTTFLVSAVFASLFVFVSRAETFVEPLRVVGGQPAPVTLRLPFARLGLDGELRRPAPVVARGHTLGSGPTLELVEAYEASRRPPVAGDLLGLFVVYLLLCWMLLMSLRVLSPGRGALIRTQLGLLGLGLVLLAAMKAFLLFTPLPAHLFPAITLPLWAAIFLDRRSALVVAVAFACFASALAQFRLGVLAVFLTGGVVAVLAHQNRPPRTLRVLGAAGLAGLSGGGVYVAARVILDRRFDVFAELTDPLTSPLLGAVVGGLASGALALALQPVGVWALGTVSRQRLLELSDLDQPLLRKIAREAPGSWEHSRAMANLAEAAANAIGADALLTRVGAYYHDLGKSCQAKYFVENLQPGEPTPHRKLDADVSADAIMAHVVEGVNILRRGGIPEPVVEFAYTHHGTSVIEYFWHKTLQAGNPRERDEAFFRYPGMRPRTKETAILMIVDSVEAASRTVDPPEREQFEEMVQRIVFVKLLQGQLDESGLTLKELRTISNQLVDSLCSIYHSRIRYPWQDKDKEGNGHGDALPLPGAATEEDVLRAREAEERRSKAAAEEE
jgi:putative nucleotidyltransferase with HDIG domain